MEKKKRLSVNEQITKLFIESIERRRELDPGMAAPWRKTWDVEFGAPRNMVSGKAYRGTNVFLTAYQGYGSPLWASMKQINDMGGQVRKGEKSTPIILWHFPNEKEEEAGKLPWVNYYRVWNTEQTTGLEDRVTKLLAPAEDRAPVDIVEAAEELLARYISRPELAFGGSRAAYNPAWDKITMPPKEAFESAAAYYRVRFHEEVHGTGHQKRLDRDGVTNIIKFGSHRYSKEELVAEMGASMLASAVGLATPETDENSVAYLDHWLTQLHANPDWLIKAGGAAQRATDYIQGIKWGAAKEEEEKAA